MSSQSQAQDVPADAEVFPQAPPSKLYMASTGAIGLLLLLGVLGLALLAVLLSGVWTWVFGILAVVDLLVLVGGFVLVHLYSRPARYEISPEGMRIVWPGRTRKLPRGAFSEIKTVNMTDLGRMRRRFGIAGIFGMFGWFQSEYLGSVDAYVTRHTDMVYLRLVNRRPLLLTPRNAETFLETLRRTVERD